MFDKLTAEETRYEQLMAEMADPSVQSDNARFRENSKALAEIQPLVEHFRRYKEVVSQIEATQELLKDPDMRELAQEEMKNLEPARDALLAEIKVLLVPKDPNDAKNVVLEIRAGTGGDEAALFASDLFRMYSRYAERQGWRIEVLNLSDSGAGGHQGSHRAHRRAARLQPAEVRERRAPGPAGTGDRSQRPDSYVDRNRRGAAGSGRSRHPRRRRRISASIRSARAARAARASTPPIPPSASRTFRPASSCRSRTRNRRSRTARKR